MGCGLLLVSKMTISPEVMSVRELKAVGGQAAAAAAAAKGCPGSTNVTSDMLGTFKSF